MPHDDDERGELSRRAQGGTFPQMMADFSQSLRDCADMLDEALRRHAGHGDGVGCIGWAEESLLVLVALRESVVHNVASMAREVLDARAESRARRARMN